MRILHLLNHCNHGHGNAHVAIDLACEQASRGHNVVYASAGGDYETLLATCNVSVAKVVQNDLRPSAIVRAFRTLWGFSRSFKPEVIHAHMMAGAVLGYGISRLVGAPLVTTVHNSFDRHSLLMRLGDRVVAVSEAERNSLVQRGYRDGRVKVVLNGPNNSVRETYSKHDAVEDLSSPCITTVCGLHKRKGVPDLLHAFHRLAPSFPDWRLNIVGQGPDEASLKKLAGDLGLNGSVRFLGQLSSPRRILAVSDIFVLASYADPCSLAVCEARVAGCAIVATAVGGTPELLGHGQAGKLVPPGSPKRLEEELRPLMANRELLASWRRKSQAGSDYFNVSRLSDDYECIYGEAIVSRSGLGLARYST